MLLIRWKYNYMKHIITNGKTYSIFYPIENININVW